MYRCSQNSHKKGEVGRYIEIQCSDLIRHPPTADNSEAPLPLTSILSDHMLINAELPRVHRSQHRQLSSPSCSRLLPTKMPGSSKSLSLMISILIRFHRPSSSDRYVTTSASRRTHNTKLPRRGFGLSPTSSAECFLWRYSRCHETNADIFGHTASNRESIDQ